VAFCMYSLVSIWKLSALLLGVVGPYVSQLTKKFNHRQNLFQEALNQSSLV